MDSIPVFQTGGAGSIPATSSNVEHINLLHGIMPFATINKDDMCEGVKLLSDKDKEKQHFKMQYSLETSNMHLS